MLESLHKEYENASLVCHVLHVAYTYLHVKFASTSKDEQKQERELNVVCTGIPFSSIIPGG